MVDSGARRIFVTGNAGSGKTTFATALAAHRGLPYFTLDSIVWDERWQKPSADERATRLGEILATDSWVIDGVSDTVLSRAELVIFLDVPRRVSARRVSRRNLRYLFRSRPGLPAHCPEILIVPKLARLIWHFPANVRPTILAEQEHRHDSSFVHVRWPATPDISRI